MMTMRATRRTREIGMTLIELLTVICIIAILAAFSYPMFAEQAAKGRRAQARSLIYEVLQHEEKFFTENNTYTTDLTALGYSDPLETSESTHSVALAVGPTGDLTTSVQITGTAIVPDAKCTTLTLTSANGQSGTGSQPSVCW
jgi:type IV pilus assembly protein PilE